MRHLSSSEQSSYLDEEPLDQISTSPITFAYIPPGEDDKARRNSFVVLMVSKVDRVQDNAHNPAALEILQGLATPVIELPASQAHSVTGHREVECDCNIASSLATPLQRFRPWELYH